MRSLLCPSRFVARSLLTAVLATGCAFAPSTPPSSTSRAAPRQVYSVWEFDTIGALNQLLDVKGCEGWRLAETFARGEKLVAVLVADGAAPQANPACRPTP